MQANWTKRDAGPSAAAPLASWLAWLLAAALLGGCSKPVDAPEARLRALLAEAEQAAEAGDHQALAAWVARDYADSAGRDRRTVALTLRGLLMRYPRLELIVTVREIQLHSPQLATVRLEILSAGAGASGLAADAFGLELSLRDDGGWKVTRAEWRGRTGRGI
ncbi:MAG TPA: hypothetical protein PLI48_07355 [Gammaproteobacteria bacterium]|nr:hypothetical protein [Gammaproteobacteria bacterium]HRP88211.1 hypothetical protein [Gammaproteobacteria bacterium]